MRRPLFFICLCLIAVSALRCMLLSSRSASAGESRGTLQALDLADRTGVTVTGEVYQKDARYLYLKSVIILQIADNLQQNIPINDYLIVEQQEWGDGMEPLMGSRICLQGRYRTFSHATNPGEFDMADYYRLLQIGGKLTDATLSDGTFSEDGQYSHVREALYRLRNYWEERLYLIFPEKEAAIMSTILLGEKAGLDSEIRELYQRNGIVHILSISGLHITIIGMGIYKFLRRIGVPPAAAALGGSLVLCLYGIMTGMGISVCRAIGMYLIRMLAELVGRTYDLLTALGVVGACMVWVHPGYLRHSGFLLSFGSVLGVGVIYPILQKMWEKKIVQSLLAGLSISLATLPIQLWFYYEVPTYSIVLNLLVLPFMSILMITGLTAMIVPGLGVIGTADCVILMGYERLCGFFDRLPFHTWNPGRPAVWQIGLYYLLLAVFLWSAQKGVWKSLIMRIGIGAAALSFMAGILAFRGWQKNEVVFLDVGQGDAICLRTAQGEVFLFDGGSSSRSQIGKYVIKPYLKYCGISHIDGICISHPDLDHCSGILELLQNCEDWGITIDRLILPAVAWGDAFTEEEQEPFGEILAAAQIREHPVQVSYVRTGDGWRSRDTTFLCLQPSEGFEPADANEASECFYIAFDNASLLLTGDVQGEAEERLLEELIRRDLDDVTVLKVAHHGSRNSTPAEFLRQISPEIALISCGRQNRYGHPHQEVLDRLEESGSVIFGTADSGAITIQFERESVKVHTQIKCYTVFNCFSY